MKYTLQPLKKVSCIYHPLRFQKDLCKTKALINLGREVNNITPADTAKLGFKIRKTDIETQKIDGSIFDTFEMVLADFQVEDKLGKTRFFQETFLVANTTLELIFGIPFLILNNADV